MSAAGPPSPPSAGETAPRPAPAPVPAPAPAPATAGANRFFIWPADARRPAELDPAGAPPGPDAGDVRYFTGLLRELDLALAGRGITFLLTWHVDAFDESFRNAVVILVGDERYRTPAWAPAVRAVFKTGGTRRNPLAATLRLAPAVAWRVLLRDARNALADPRRGAAPANVLELPMGYYGLTDGEPVPFEKRTTDLFFAGSIEPGPRISLRPRLAARRQMLSAVQRTERRLDGLVVDCSRSGPFANPERMLGADEYSARLRQARIALCPRGNFDETFRLVEAARCGCVAIVEQLPQRWYNRDSPAVAIDRWHRLPEVVEGLLADPGALARRGESMRQWWTERLSEAAAARFVVEALDRV